MSSALNLSNKLPKAFIYPPKSVENMIAILKKPKKARRVRKDFRQPCRSCAQSDALACFYLTLCRNRRGLSTQKRQKPGRYVKYLPGPKPPPVCSARPALPSPPGPSLSALVPAGAPANGAPGAKTKGPRYGGRIRQARAVRSGQQRDDDAGQKRQQHRDNQNPADNAFLRPSSPYAENIIISILAREKSIANS